MMATDESLRLFVAQLADVVYANDDEDAACAATVNAAVSLIEGCDHASVMVDQIGGFVTVASNDAVGRGIDELESAFGEGPCIDASRTGSVSHVADLQEQSRWPRLTSRLLDQTSVRAIAGFNLKAGEGRVASLNLSSDTAGGFEPESISQGLMLASVLSLALQAYHQRNTAGTLAR